MIGEGRKNRFQMLGEEDIADCFEHRPVVLFWAKYSPFCGAFAPEKHAIASEHGVLVLKDRKFA
jgi:hypothetical protein